MKKVLILVIIFFMVSFKHPFYLSVTNLRYNVKEKALQGSVKIFVNDLESALKQIHKKKIDLVNVKDSVATNNLLNLYLQTHFSLKLNNSPKAFKMIGFEKEEEVIWLYIEFKKCEEPKKVEISNTVLFDFIKEQTNIVQLEVNGNQKSSKATNPDKGFMFAF